ncbi:DUF748 domain-containing protein [Aquiflexum sp. LQ15W]|uniref:DUF748 domain-containing protein n=1 Tax=Cognataquiflexum nitidum TaxID=2922272 RepID=UPI001F136582|nr:DUF748 domain-containing protein [Cognataquiflexum nitidum]MCH6200113.1 DUF748 domain-containing protein [Cognataquiflexum nitidum]
MKKFLITVFVLILIGFFAFKSIPTLVNKYLNSNADRLISNMITRTSSFGEHEVTFGEIVLNYDYSGTFLKIRNIRVTPSESLGKDMIAVNLTVDHVDLTGFQWFPFLFRNTITVDSALLDNIKIISSSPPWDSLFHEPKKPKKKTGKDYDLIEVKNFRLNDFSVEIKNNLYDSVRISLVNMNVNAKEFKLTKEDIENPKSLFDVEMIHGSIEKAQFHFDKFRQSTLVEDIDFDTKTKKMSIGYIGLHNKMDRYAYTSLFADRQTWIDISKSKMELSGVNFGSYFKKGIIEVDTLSSDGLHLELFVDKRKKKDLKKRPQMIHKTIENLKQIIHIEHLFLKNSYIKIEERPDNASPRSAFLYFSDINAHITNVSNYIERRGKNRTLELDLTAKLMGEGPLAANVKFDLEKPDGRFTLKGTLGKIKLSSLNTMIEPEAKIGLKSGTINRLDFNILANDYDGSGELIIRYENLEVELLNKNYEADEKVLRKIGAYLANKIIIKSNNPNKKGEVQKGNVYFIRETHKSMFAYWWKLIFSGMKSTLTRESMEEMKKKALDQKSSQSNSESAQSDNSNEKSGDPKTSKKLERQEKKEERKNHREERKAAKIDSALTN